ncbi:MULTISPECIES: polyprenyl synthetase family protein [unclassified Sporolactobacillus]|uniref:polyprenyl synthetase family protein n=1 Tax=unclassified Sporolactobacillus TaxID=2628533 RepID=UPI002368D34E|nr:polyprenyl synthetase family protein [Sporolactobacillus sp. CQH2019]MDD9150346.1 polyprenyl synthetase family protein [Sporolactobacillus sp. CQH2019]
MDIKKEIRRFLLDYLKNSEWDSETCNLISSLLHGEGKIFHEPALFTWGEFSFYISSVFCEDAAVHDEQAACAATVELLILATDIIDELADGDMESPVLSKLTPQRTLTLSSMLLMESLYLILKYSAADRLGKLSCVIRNLRTASIGQWRDLSFRITENVPSERDYFSLIEQKSVSLLRLVFEVNAIENVPAWENIARYIGFSGQLRNDAADILRDAKSDLTNRKATLPLIKAVEFSKQKDNGWLFDQLKLLGTSRDGSRLRQDIRDYIKKTGAIDYCLILSKVYLNRAVQLIKNCGETQRDKTRIQQLIDYLEG